MRGGTREGAGRPAGTTKTNNRQSITIRLPPDLIDQLNTLSRNMKGKFIEQAIRERFNQAG